MSGYKTTIATAIAEALAASGVARWAPSGAYPAAPKPAIFLAAVPPTPDASITLTTYPVRPAGLDNTDEVLGLQVRTRAAGADPRAVWDLDDAVRDVLHGLTNTALGDYRVTSIRHVSGASLGQDDNRRWSWSSNYYIQLPRREA